MPMKKLFQKINTRGTRSVMLGLVLAFGLSFASSLMVGAATSNPGTPEVQPFIGQSASLMSRIGSMAIGRASVPNWIISPLIINNPCYYRNPDLENAKQTCLDVLGGATFANLLINQTAYFNADTVVGVNSGFGNPGGGGFSIDNSTLTIENSGANSGFMVSGLGYFVNGIFAPRNLTTTATVCATSNGTLVRCTGSNPITYSWQIGNWGACTGVVNPSCNGSYQTTNGGVCEGTWQSTGPGSCSGTPTTGNKIKWDGTPFEWTDGRVYYQNSTGNGRAGCGAGYDLLEVNPNNNDIDYNAANGGAGTACYAAQGETWANGSHYEVSVDNDSQGGQDWWHRLTITTGVDDGNGPSGKVIAMALNSPARAYGTCESQGTQSSCQAKPGCNWTPGQQQTNYCSPATTQQSCLARNPACTWNPNTTTVSCSGPTTQNECTSQNPACTFNPGNPGTHSRSVVCKDSNGQTVDQQLCIDNVSPKPATTEACS